MPAPSRDPLTAASPLRVVTFGEVMARLMPPGRQRLLQTTSFELTFGGAEVNVAVDLARLGVDVAFVTRLPADNDLAESCVSQIRGLGVDTRHVLRGGGRMGLYFVERGAGQRGGTVLYDRAGSAFAPAEPGEFDWDAIFDGAGWFHFTGITPALGENCAAATLDAVRAAKAKGLTVSCDLNFRRMLWDTATANRVMGGLMPHVDVCIANDGSAGDVFGIRDDSGDGAGVARQLAERFGLRAVALTRRESHSADRNSSSGLLHTGGQSYESRRYELEVVDRLGGGDAFAAGLIYAMLTSQSPQDAIEFATAAGCLKHTVPGDFNLVKLEEINALAAGDTSGRVRR